MNVDTSLLDNLLEDLPQYKLELSDFKIISEIGEGGYGKVYQANYVPKSKICAIKQLFDGKAEQDNFKRFTLEIRTMVSCLLNPCVVKFIGYTSVPPYSIVTEYMPNNSLESFIYSPHEEKRLMLNNTIQSQIAMGVAWGMMMIHNSRILYRDLKVANILLDEKFFPKICDFGIARFYEEDTLLTKQIGTPTYIAPEAALGNTYDFKADVYAYGLFLYELSEKQRPYANMKASEIFQNVIKKGERPQLSNRTNGPIRELIKQCWAVDPESRPSFQSIYEGWKTGKCEFEGTNKIRIQEYAKALDKTKNYLNEKQKVREAKEKGDLMKKKLRSYKNWGLSKPNDNNEINSDDSSDDEGNENDNDNQYESSQQNDPNSSSSEDDSDSGLTELSTSKSETDNSDKKSQGQNKQNNNNQQSTKLDNNNSKNAILTKKQVQIQIPSQQNNQEDNQNDYYSDEYEYYDEDEINDEEEDIEDILSNFKMPISMKKTFLSLNSYDEQITNGQNINLDDFAKPGFTALLEQFFNSTQETFMKNSENILQYLIADTPDPIIAAILDDSIEMMRKNKNLIPFFEKCSFFHSLTELSEKFNDKIMICYGFLFTLAPFLLTDKYTDDIFKLIKRCPKETLALFSEYSLMFSSLENPWPVLDILLRVQDDIKDTQYGKQLLQILYFLTNNFEDYNKPRHSHVLATFEEYMSSSNTQTAIAAYDGIMQLTDDFSGVDFNYVLSHLATDDLWENAISLLLRCKNIPVSLDLITLASKHASDSKHVWNLLLMIAKNPDFLHLFADSTNWMNGAKNYPEECSRLLLMLFVHPEYRNKILAADEFSNFINGIIESNELILYKLIPSLLTRVQITETDFIKLQKNEAIHNIIMKSISSDNIEIHNSCLIVIDTLARVCYSPDYLLYLPKLVSFLRVPELYQKAVRVIVSLSFYKETTKHLVELGLVTYFNNLKSYKQYEKLADAFLKNAKLFVLE